MRSGAFLFVVLALIAGAMLVLVLDGDGQVAGLRDHQFAELVHVGIWGLVLSAGLLFAFRGRFSQAVKSAAIWFLAFLVLIGVYAFAPDLGNVKDRFLAALMPGTTVEVAGSQGRQFMVLRGNDDHFRVDGSIDGEPVSFMVDTGASIIALDRTTAESIGIDTASLRFASQVMTANGIARAAPVFLDTVRIGDIVRHDVEAAVVEGEGIGMTLLGMSFLGTLTSFDFRGERLILTD